MIVFICYYFFFNDTATTEIYTLSLHDALPIWLTKRILGETVKQSRLTYNPVIGIKIKSIGISKVFGKDRRNLNVDLELINVGNAPAIEVQIDSEIIYTNSEIKGEKSIPARFEPSMVDRKSVV